MIVSNGRSMFTTALIVVACLATATASAGWIEMAKLNAGDAAADDRFGCSVALQGQTAVIGAQFGRKKGISPIMSRRLIMCGWIIGLIPFLIPTIEIIALAASDGGRFCECDNCRALDIESRPRVGRLSNRAAVFNNEVARRVGKRFPDVLIKVGAYVYYYLPPTIKDFRVEPNLLVQICHNSSPNQPLIGDAKGIQHADVVRQWASMADNLGVYEAYSLAAWGRWHILRPMVHFMRHDIPWYRDADVKAFYTQNVQQPWRQCPLNHYVAAKLAWNADLDVDWLIDDYCRKFFDDAAEPMRDYLLGLEDAMVRWEQGGCGGGTPGFAAVAFDGLTRDRLRASLDRARQAAGSEIVRRRVAAVRRGFDEFEESLLSGRIKRELDWQTEKKRLKEAK